MPTKNNNPPPLLADPMTMREACELLSISRSTMARYKSAGGGPAYYSIGGREWYERADVIAFLRTLRVEPTANQDEIIEAMRKPGTASRAPRFRRKPTDTAPPRAARKTL